jgi:hypothetical protein
MIAQTGDHFAAGDEGIVSPPERTLNVRLTLPQARALTATLARVVAQHTLDTDELITLDTLRAAMDRAVNEAGE